MTIKSFLRITLLILLLIFMQAIDVIAEKVKPLNPDCEVCPTVISYEGNEAKKILGFEGSRWLFKLKNRDAYQKTSKIDLDGLKTIGTENDPDQGYELLVFSYKHSVIINSLQDSSSIKIKTDYKRFEPGGATDAWMPEIQLTSSDAIEKNDDLFLAWEKMKASKIYRNINRDGASHNKWEDNLSQFIFHILKVISEK